MRPTTGMATDPKIKRYNAYAVKGIVGFIITETFNTLGLVTPSSTGTNLIFTTDGLFTLGRTQLLVSPLSLDEAIVGKQILTNNAVTIVLSGEPAEGEYLAIQIEVINN